MAILKRINTILSFFLEIVMFAIFVYWGFHTGESLWLKLALGIGVPVVVFIVWGVFLAPEAGQRVKGSAGVVVSVLLFYLAVLMLFQTRHLVLGTIMLVIVALNRTLAVIWRQS